MFPCPYALATNVKPRFFLAQSATLSSHLPMETPRSSNVRSPREREPVMECHLALTALSGTVVNISMSVAKFDRFEDLEDHVVDCLSDRLVLC